MGDQVWRALSRFHLVVVFVSVVTFLAPWFYSVSDSYLGAGSFSDPYPRTAGAALLLKSSVLFWWVGHGHLSLPDPPVFAMSARR